MGGVDLEVAAKSLTCVGTTEPVGAERYEPALDEARDLVRHRAYVVGHRDHRASFVAERPGDVSRAWLLGRMQPVPTLDGDRLAPVALCKR